MSNYPEKISIVWSYEDVLLRAESNGTKITKDQACEILSEMDSKHDANCGISWDTIDFYLGEL